VPIAVRKIKAADHHAINGRLYISAVTIVGVARKPTAGFSRLLIAGEDGHAVPGFLTMPDGAIAGTLDLPAWKPRQTTITPAGNDVRFRSLRANICRSAPLGDSQKLLAGGCKGDVIRTGSEGRWYNRGSEIALGWRNPTKTEF
jgi:hypothetical protein